MKLIWHGYLIFNLDIYVHKTPTETGLIHEIKQVETKYFSLGTKSNLKIFFNQTGPQLQQRATWQATQSRMRHAGASPSACRAASVDTNPYRNLKENVSSCLFF